MNNLEEQLIAFENTLGKQLTLIDNHGFFIDGTGSSIFPRSRHSHQSLQSCMAGFCKIRCVDHCRHANNKVFENGGAVFIDKCWNGIVQLATPLIVNGRHEATLYLGNWRPEKYLKNSAISKSDWLKIAVYSEDELKSYMKLCELIGSGIIQSILQKKLPGDPRALELIQWVDKNLKNKPRLLDLAEWWGVSVSHCSYKCKKLIGMSFSELVISQRIKRTSALLSNTSLSLSEIADQLGFNDAFHLGKQFKKTMKISPGEFRKKGLNKLSL